MIKTDSLDHVVFSVQDYERSKKFYEDALGMTVHHEEGQDPIRGFLNAGPGHLLAIFQKDGHPTWREGRPRLTDGKEVIGGSEFNRVSFTTNSGTRESVNAELENKGIKVHSRVDDPEGLYFEDLDGHPIRLYVGELNYPSHSGSFA